MKYFLVYTLSFVLLGCNPFYVTRLAYEQTKVLTGREKISKIINDPGKDSETKEKLSLILKARSFGESHGLSLKDNYTKYYDVGRSEFSWVVMAAKKDSLSPFTWWFPVVGSVPYKGFFTKESAVKTARELEESDFETFVRPTRAVSTLGWFSDPVFSTMLTMPLESVIETIFHESFHATVWVKGNVQFNETAAEVFAGVASVEFFTELFQSCKKENISSLCEKESTLLAQAKNSVSFQRFFSKVITETFHALESLYASHIPFEQKMDERKLLYTKTMAPFFLQFPQSSFPREINNAAILQSYLYYVQTDDFIKLYEQAQTLPTFLETLKEISHSKEPFAELSKKTKVSL